MQNETYRQVTHMNDDKLTLFLATLSVEANRSVILSSCVLLISELLTFDMNNRIRSVGNAATEHANHTTSN